ncbi:hypothetical protein BVRB_3g065980 [Beta vulgaris subsp. vulgaris]|nr:hypothetical protein BVRB_3g065980 [Beta vulgaris subsp. vulgaris]
MTWVGINRLSIGVGSAEASNRRRIDLGWNKSALGMTWVVEIQ